MVPLAVSAFLTSRKKAAAAELADWMQSPEGQASSLESIGRSPSRRNHAVPARGGKGRGYHGPARGRRGQAGAEIIVDEAGDHRPGPGARRIRRPAHRKMGKSLYLRNEVFAAWIEKVDALVQDEPLLGVELILDDAQIDGIDTSTSHHLRSDALVSCCAITAPNRPRSVSRWVRPRRPTSPAGCRCGCHRATARART